VQSGRIVDAENVDRLDLEVGVLELEVSDWFSGGASAV
jgi:hypothetical protein